jgi:hypothetical protein
MYRHDFACLFGPVDGNSARPRDNCHFSKARRVFVIFITFALTLMLAVFFNAEVGYIPEEEVMNTVAPTVFTVAIVSPAKLMLTTLLKRKLICCNSVACAPLVIFLATVFTTICWCFFLLLPDPPLVAGAWQFAVGTTCQVCNCGYTWCKAGDGSTTSMPVCTTDHLEPSLNPSSAPFHCGVCGNVFGWLLFTVVLPAWYLHQLEDWIKSFIIYESFVRGPCAENCCCLRLASWVCGLSEADRDAGKLPATLEEALTSGGSGRSFGGDGGEAPQPAVALPVEGGVV